MFGFWLRLRLAAHFRLLGVSGGGEERVVHERLRHRAGEGRNHGRSKRHPQKHHLIRKTGSEGMKFTDVHFSRQLAGESHTRPQCKLHTEVLI